MYNGNSFSPFSMKNICTSIKWSDAEPLVKWCSFNIHLLLMSIHSISLIEEVTENSTKA